MPRKIEFDVDASIEQATRLFWTQGYENTSLDELLGSMQISPGSFYNKFQSKKKLYRLCMDQYNDRHTVRRTKILFNPATPVPQAVRDFFRLVIEEVTGAEPARGTQSTGQSGERKELPRGCLMTNSICGEVLAQPDLGEYVITGIRDIQERLADRLREGVDQGDLPADFDAETAAGLMISWIQGLNKASQLGKSAEQLQKENEMLLSGLGMGR